MSTGPLMSRPSIVDWARSATGRLHGLIGDDMVAADLVGSGALGGFVPEQSDVDLVAICPVSAADERKQAIIDVLTRRP